MPENDVLTRRYDEYGWPEDAVVRVRAIEAEVERLREENARLLKELEPHYAKER